MSSPISVCPSSLPLGADHTQAVALDAPAGPRPGPARSRLFLGSRGTSFRVGCGVHRLVPLSSRSDLLFSPRACWSFSSLEFPVGLLQTSSSLRRSRPVTRRGLHAFFSFLRSFDGLQGSGSRPWPTEAASLGFSFLLFRGYARLSACLRTFGHSLSISRGTGAPGPGRPASPRRSPSPGRLLVDSLTSPRNRFRHLSLPRRVATEVSAQVPFF